MERADERVIEPLGSLGLAREELPQIADVDKFLRWLTEQGVEAHLMNLPAHDLCPTQAELESAKIDAMIANPDDTALLASADRYILDGHHRWAARFCVNPDSTVRVWVIGLPMSRLLKLARLFPGAKYKSVKEAVEVSASELASGIAYEMKEYGDEAVAAAVALRNLRENPRYYAMLAASADNERLPVLTVLAAELAARDAHRSNMHEEVELPVVCVSRVPRLQALIEVATPHAEGLLLGCGRFSRARALPFAAIEERIPGGVAGLRLFLEGPVAVSPVGLAFEDDRTIRYFRLEGPRDPVLVFEFDEANQRAIVFATTTPKEAIGFDPRAELLESPLEESRMDAGDPWRNCPACRATPREAISGCARCGGYGRVCPVCESKVASTCRCSRSDSVCENGHKWYFCPTHKRAVIAEVRHDESGCSCIVETEEVGYEAGQTLKLIYPKGAGRGTGHFDPSYQRPDEIVGVLKVRKAGGVWKLDVEKTDGSRGRFTIRLDDFRKLGGTIVPLTEAVPEEVAPVDEKGGKIQPGSGPSSGDGATRAVGGFRFEIGKNKKNKPRKDVQQSIQNRLNARRGLAGRISAARKFHQSSQGAAMHRDLARYNKGGKLAESDPSLVGHAETCEKCAKTLVVMSKAKMYGLDAYRKAVRELCPTGLEIARAAYRGLVEDTMETENRNVDDLLDALLRKLITIESTDVLQDVNFTDDGSIYLYFDPSLTQSEMDEVLLALKQEVEQASIASTPTDKSSDWWVVFVPSAQALAAQAQAMAAQAAGALGAPAPLNTIVKTKMNTIDGIAASIDVDALVRSVGKSSAPMNECSEHAAPAPSFAPTTEGAVMMFWSSREDRTPKMRGVASGVAGQEIPSLREAAARGEGSLFLVRALNAEAARATIRSSALRRCGPNVFTNLDPRLVAAT
jgi:hypothetical protein